jgi:hypothetical protein
MAWNSQIFAYCERGQNPAFWAEPFNAISNVAFLAAALAAAFVWLRQPAHARGAAELVLIGLVGATGTGSFLFHTFATRWAMIADAAPIGVFMFAYTGYALRRYLQLSWPWVALGLALFAALLVLAFTAPCPLALRSLVKGSACLNGSLGYVPTLVMLMGVGIAAAEKRHPAARSLLVASALFAISLFARTLDLEMCGATRLLGVQLSLHAVWHTVNALMLALLLITAVRHRALPPR